MKNVRTYCFRAFVVIAMQLTSAHAIEVYQAKTIEPYQAKQAQTPPAKSVEIYQGAGQARVFSKAEREQMQRNDVAAGRSRESMSSPAPAKKTVTDSQSRVNHYSNMHAQQNRMDQSGTLGYNPYRNQ